MAKFDSKSGAECGKKTSRKNIPNKVTKAFKDILVDTIHALEDNSDKKKKDKKTGLLAFAKDNPKEFYRIASKLVPQDIIGELNGDITIRVKRD